MAQLNDLLVMGQSTLLGPVNIQNNLNVSNNTNIEGILTLKASQYTDSRTEGYALNLRNSNVVGVNSIYMADLSDVASEGIHFYRGENTVDTLWVKNGVPYFTPNRTLGTNGTNYTIYHTGNLSFALSGTNNTTLTITVS